MSKVLDETVENLEFIKEAINHYELALKSAFPVGASGHVFHHWNEARKFLGWVGSKPTSITKIKGGSMSKHTEGPWNVSNHNSDYIEDSDRKLVACVWGSSQELEANARLIAAAPELLEALIDCRRALEIANAAIAKAKGEE